MTNEIIGLLRPDGAAKALRFERTYATGTDDLWSALTDAERLRRWFARVEGDLREGGEYEIIFDEDDPGARTRGRILDCQPGAHLFVSWLFEGAGWHVYLEQLEADLVGGEGHVPSWDERWKELKPGYDSQLS
jgi:uncharacterized protein YndB with AHSA1/START domain